MDESVHPIVPLVKDFRGPMETCGSLFPLPISSKFNCPICHYSPPKGYKMAQPLQLKDRSYKLPYGMAFAGFSPYDLHIRGVLAWSIPKSCQRMGKSFCFIKITLPEKTYYEVCKRRLHRFKLSVNNKSEELQHWLAATHLGEPG